jgi:hypothetical protein
MSEWQPIERCAPKKADGTVLVGVWVGDRWSSWTVDASDENCPLSDLGNDGENGDPPTHWARLPSPPVPAA